MNRVDSRSFHWLLPGERKIAVWAMGRVQRVQGDSRQLVAGAYVILASLWGSVGGLLVLVGIFTDVTSSSGSGGGVLLLLGIALCAVAGVRIAQSRVARANE